MPLDVLGRTRATLTEPASFSPWPEGLGNLVKLCRAGDRALQLLLFNEEFLVSVSHQLALITSLPFVHTARRYYRLNGLVDQTWSFRGSKSRNKVSVGEPAEGSLPNCQHELLLVPKPGACAPSVHTSTHTCAPSVVLWPG